MSASEAPEVCIVIEAYRFICNVDVDAWTPAGGEGTKVGRRPPP